MDPAIARRLIELNQGFYEEFSEQFSNSRARLNPGIERLLDASSPLGSLLDLGCGDARVGHAWAAGRFVPPVDYVGVDRSGALLRARAGTPDAARRWQLLELDLAEPGWREQLCARDPAACAGFDTIVAFSFLHHLPGRAGRVQFLRELRSLLVPGGRWVLSVWQLLHLPRLRRRVVEWSEVGLEASQLELGDLLLDWRRGGRGLRYVHHYELDELREDCAAAGLSVLEHLRSDGESGDLGLYLRG